jgi:hypothetical protein
LQNFLKLLTVDPHHTQESFCQPSQKNILVFLL